MGTLDNTNNFLTINLGKYEKKFTYINSIQYNLDRYIVNNINKILFQLKGGWGKSCRKEGKIFDSMKNIRKTFITKIVLMLSYMLISLIGGLAVVFGEVDDSPGLGGIGLILIIISAVGTYKIVKRK